MVYYALNMVDQGEVKQNTTETQTSQGSEKPRGGGDSGEQAQEVFNRQKEEQRHQEREQRKQELKQQAAQRLTLKKELAKTTKAAQQVQQELTILAQEPKKHHVDFVLEQGSTPPQESDLLVILKSIAEEARVDPNVGKNETKLSGWIMEMEVASAHKAAEAKKELLTYKQKLAQQLGKAITERMQAIATTSGKTEADVRRKEAEQYWREKLVGDEITPEEFINVVEKPLLPIQGGQEATTWQLWDETDAQFQQFPPNLQRLIKEINDTHSSSPSIFGADYVRAKIEELEKIETDNKIDDRTFREWKNKIRNRLNDILIKREKSVQEQQVLQQLSLSEKNRREEAEKHTRIPMDELRSELTDAQYLKEVTTGQRSQALKDLISQGAFKVNEEEVLADQIEAISTIEGGLNAADKELAQKAKGLFNERINFLRSRGVVSYSERELESRFRQVGFTEPDIDFVQHDLADPESILKFILDHGYKEFEKRVIKVYGRLYKSATRSTRSAFQNNWGIFIQEPVAQYLNSKIELARQYFKQHEQDIPVKDGERLGEIEHFDKKTKTRETKHVPLHEAFHTLITNAEMRKEFTEYTHNVYVILQTRGELKDLAGYSEKIKTHDLELLFTGESLLQPVVHIYEQELTRALASKNWEISPELFTEDTAGEIELEKNVKKIVSNLRNDKGEKWDVLDIEQAVSEAHGMVLGVTAIAIDRLAEARPPTQGTDRFAASYFGEKILGEWNPMYHSTIRWASISAKNFDVLYAQAFQKGTLTPWDHRSLSRVKNNFVGESKVSFTYEGLAGLPILHVANLFGLAGLFGRGPGWRIHEATDYLLENEQGESPVDNMGVVDYGAIDWDRSWENLKKGGTSLLYSWIDKRADKAVYPEEKKALDELKERYKTKKERAQAIGKIGLTPDEDDAKAQEEKKIKEKYKAYHDRVVQDKKIELRKEVFGLVRERNPLKFAFFDKEDIFSKKSLRERAYRAVFGVDSPYSATGLSEAEKTAKKEELSKIERNCFLITERLVKDKLWKLSDLTSEDLEQIIPDESERNHAINYWKKVIEEIDKPVDRFLQSDDLDVADTEKFHQLKGKVEHIEGRTKLHFSSMVEEFAYRKFAYTFGADDLDYEMIRWSEGGEHVVGRVFKDAAALSEGQKELFKFDSLFRDISMKHDYRPMIEAIMKATQPVRDIHGEDKGDEVAYYMATLFKAFFAKHWAARLPLGFGSVIGTATKESISQLRYGRYAYSVDEQILASFVLDLVSAGQIPQEKFMPERSNFFIASRIKAEIGGRTEQAVYDILRTAIPLIILLMMWQGTKEETKN